MPFSSIFGMQRAKGTERRRRLGEAGPSQRDDRPRRRTQSITGLESLIESAMGRRRGELNDGTPTRVDSPRQPAPAIPPGFRIPSRRPAPLQDTPSLQALTPPQRKETERCIHAQYARYSMSYLPLRPPRNLEPPIPIHNATAARKVYTLRAQRTRYFQKSWIVARVHMRAQPWFRAWESAGPRRDEGRYGFTPGQVRIARNLAESLGSRVGWGAGSLVKRSKIVGRRGGQEVEKVRCGGGVLEGRWVDYTSQGAGARKAWLRRWEGVLASGGICGVARAEKRERRSEEICGRLGMGDWEAEGGGVRGSMLVDECRESGGEFRGGLDEEEELGDGFRGRVEGFRQRLNKRNLPQSTIWEEEEEEEEDEDGDEDEDEDEDGKHNAQSADDPASEGEEGNGEEVDGKDAFAFETTESANESEESESEEEDEEEIPEHSPWLHRMASVTTTNVHDIGRIMTNVGYGQDLVGRRRHDG